VVPDLPFSFILTHCIIYLPLHHVVLLCKFQGRAFQFKFYCYSGPPRRLRSQLAANVHRLSPEFGCAIHSEVLSKHCAEQDKFLFTACSQGACCNLNHHAEALQSFEKSFDVRVKNAERSVRTENVSECRSSVFIRGSSPEHLVVCFFLHEHVKRCMLYWS
jgi:hypothetical protein